MTTSDPPDDMKHLVNAVLAAIKVEGTAYTLGAEGKLRVGKALALYKEDPKAKKRALREVVCLAWFFEKKQGSPHVSKELLDVAQVAAGDLATLRESLSLDADTLHTAAKRYQKMLGQSEGPKAPKLGESADEGTVKAGSTLIGRLRRV